MSSTMWPSRPGSTRIKICGIQDPDMGLLAIEAGASAIGLVRHEPSPRHVSDNTAMQIRKQMPDAFPCIDVVVDPDPDGLRLCPNWIQFHGEESEDLITRARGPVVRGFAFSMEAVRRWDACPDVDILLVDGPGKGAGTSFRHDDLAEIRETIKTPLVIAGGLDPDSVGEAISVLRPWGVDVSSGVESQRGVKDPQRIKAFCDAVRDADSSLG